MTHIHEHAPINNTYPDTRLPLPAVSSSAVSWGAIFAGAAAAASLSLILLMLGAGLGLTSVSPWESRGLDAGTVGIAAIAWLTFTQIVASGMGGYLSGRLRTKWIDTHRDEVYFRDTAHGFLTWAVAALISAVLLTSTVGSIIGGGAKIVGTVAGGAAATTAAGAASMANGSSVVQDSSMDYFVNSMFRASSPATPANNAADPASPTAPATPTAPQQPVSPAQLGEVSGIFVNSITTGALPQDDRQYVARLIAQNTGISQQEAEQRVQSTYDKAQAKLKETKQKAQQAADTARKATSYLMLWTFISLLAGAFVASLCATFGGRQRDL
ncbi:hypothetical protein CHU32_17745 [Superficieibacter electus]|uniref:Transmembrane protein n=1 Tax=Superficieibacter electus TaxID=2022662 RepID=A0A2P5GLZ2_9ENTR|nr:hypothetical protein [Superficieibacter electus]POP43065.1 hypothetical protein CHU33_17645 [Superficieibacter electus]POP46560.1 hypothetical protein CHU32_17745 [Superficieibacter electus]